MRAESNEAEAADRRGRRAALPAAIAVAVLIAIAFWLLRDWWAVERYVRLREVGARKDRLAVEAYVREGSARTAPVVAILWIDDLGSPGTLALGANHEASSPLSPLASLFDPDQAARRVPPPPEGWAGAAAAAARSHGWVPIGVTGQAGEGVLPAGFEVWVDDVPAYTSFLEEGHAGWVTRRAIDALRERGDRPVCLWLRYTELLPPVLGHSHFAAPSARLSELASIDTFATHLRAYLGDRARAIVVLTGGVPDVGPSTLVWVDAATAARLPREGVGYAEILRAALSGAAGDGTAHPPSSP